MNNTRIQPQSRGAALLIFIVFFLIASTILVLGIGSGVYQGLAEYRVLSSSKASFFAVEAGIEDAIYRHRAGSSYSNTESFSVNGVPVHTNRSFIVDTVRIIVDANAGGAVRYGQVELVVGEGASFNFGLQSGNGGITLSNNSSVLGNVYSNGHVEGQGNATIYGEVVSAGAGGQIETIHATGSAWAHHIEDSVIDKDAYYMTKIGTIVGGVSYPNSPDQAPIGLPIADADVQEIKDNITDSGSVIASTSPQCSSGTYVIDVDTTLSNVKIECNVEMKKQGAATVITLEGPIWIEGNLSFSQGPSIVASSSLGAFGAVIVVDKESNRTTSSQITINQSTNFTSGDSRSFIFLLSMNNSAELGGSETAINVAQSANGKVLVYAAHGRVVLGNSITLKEVTGYQIDVNNGAQVVYESGLASLLFTTGPGGGYTVWSWEEI